MHYQRAIALLDQLRQPADEQEFADQKSQHQLISDLLKQFAALNPDPTQILRTSNLHFDYATYLMQQGEIGESYEHYQLALNGLTDDADGVRQQGRIHTNLSNLFRSQGRMEEASEEAVKALHIFRATPYRRAVATVLSNLSAIEIELHHPYKAIEYLDEAIVICQALNDVVREGQITGDYATALLILNKRDQAKKYFEHAIELARISGDRGSEGMAIGTYAIALAEEGKSDEAVALYNEALEIHIGLKDMRMAAVTMNNLANLLAAKGDLSAAETLLTVSAHELRILGDNHSEAIAIGILAEIAVMRQQFTDAYHIYHNAISIFRSVKDDLLTGQTVCELGELLLEQGELEEASQYFRDGMACFERCGLQSREPVNYFGFIESLLRLGKEREAGIVLKNSSDSFGVGVNPADEVPFHIMNGWFALPSELHPFQQGQAIDSYFRAREVILKYGLVRRSLATRCFDRFRNALLKLGVAPPHIPLPETWIDNQHSIYKETSLNFSL